MLDGLVFGLWYGPFRRVFRVVFTRLPPRSRVTFGPLRGSRVMTGGWPCALGIFELHVQRAITDRLEPGDVFYDIGANHGYISLLAAKRVGPEGHVYAFEPHSGNVERIRELMEA